MFQPSQPSEILPDPIWQCPKLGPAVGSPDAPKGLPSKTIHYDTHTTIENIEQRHNEWLRANTGADLPEWLGLSRKDVDHCLSLLSSAELAPPPKAEEVGVKYTEGKPDFSLIPPDALTEVAKVLTYGAEKYPGRDNWKKVSDPKNKYFAAAQRHLWKLHNGETIDPETGLHHAAHAIANCLFLHEFYNVQK